MDMDMGTCMGRICNNTVWIWAWVWQHGQTTRACHCVGWLYEFFHTGLADLSMASLSERMT